MFAGGDTPGVGIDGLIRVPNGGNYKTRGTTGRAVAGLESGAGGERGVEREVLP